MVSLNFEDDLKVLRSWFQNMSLKEYCKKTVETVWTHKGLQELKAYLQKQPGPTLAFEKPATNEPKVRFPFLCEAAAWFAQAANGGCKVGVRLYHLRYVLHH